MCNNDKMSRYCNLFQSHDSQLIWKPDQALPYVMHFENGQKKSLFRRSETKKKLVIWPEIIRTKAANIEQTEDILWFSTVKESYLKGHLLAFDSSEAVFEFKQGDTTLIVRVSVMSDEELFSICELYKNQGKIPPINKENLVQLIAWDEWVVGQSRLLPREVYYVETDDIASLVGINVRIEVCFDILGKNKKWIVEWWDPSHERRMLANEIEYDNGVFSFTRDQSEGGWHYRFSVMELDTYNEIVRKTLLSAPLFSDVEEMNRAFFEADYD